MIRHEDIGVNEISVGQQGVREVYAGKDIIYKRYGGVVYIDLTGYSEEFIPRNTTAPLLDADGAVFKVRTP